MLIGFGTGYHPLPLDIFLKVLRCTPPPHHVLKLGRLCKRRTISWQEDIPGTLGCDAETKGNALHGVEGQGTWWGLQRLGMRKSLGRRLLASTLGSIISFTERQLCYIAQEVNSCTFFTLPLRIKLFKGKQILVIFYFLESKHETHWSSPFHSSLYAT